VSDLVYVPFGGHVPPARCMVHHSCYDQSNDCCVPCRDCESTVMAHLAAFQLGLFSWWRWGLSTSVITGLLNAAFSAFTICDRLGHWDYCLPVGELVRNRGLELPGCSCPSGQYFFDRFPCIISCLLAYDQPLPEVITCCDAN